MNFLNLHIVQTIPYSNLNRDDNGSPKSMVFGAAARGRLSSQALKRHQRVAFEADSAADMTTRSKVFAEDVTDRVEQALSAAGTELTDEQRTALHTKVAKDLNKLTSKSDTAKGTLIWLADDERDAIVRRVVADHASDDAAFELDELVATTTRSLAIAAWGRFFAAATARSMDAAVQVAHAFTTHRQVKDLDYFTAVDDITQSLGEHEGAGHLDVAEFTSGVFYRHASIDRRQLCANWVDATAPDAPERLRAFARAAVTALPTGKQNSTAPHTLPALVLAEEAAQPLSYAPAFERPVPDSDHGYEAPSVRALLAYADRIRRIDPDGLGEARTVDAASDDGDTIADLCEFVADWVQR